MTELSKAFPSDAWNKTLYPVELKRRWRKRRFITISVFDCHGPGG